MKDYLVKVTGFANYKHFNCYLLCRATSFESAEVWIKGNLSGVLEVENLTIEIPVG